MEGDQIHGASTICKHLKVLSLKCLFPKNPLGQLLLFYISETSDLTGIISFCVLHCVVYPLKTPQAQPQNCTWKDPYLIVSTFSPRWKPVTGWHVWLMTTGMYLCIQILTSAKPNSKLNGLCPIAAGAVDLNAATQPLLLWSCFSCQIWKMQGWILCHQRFLAFLKFCVPTS